MHIAVCDDEKEIRDILLIDIQMPGKNGMETAKVLRRKNKIMEN